MANNHEYLEIDDALMQKLMNVFAKSHFLTTDSRKVEKGCIFLGLKGENFNGNSFAQKALECGAELCVIDDEKYYVDERTILVKSSEQCLQKFANYYRHTLSIPIIGISGTNGKTTTKELLYEVLSKKYITYATTGNLNNQLGVCFTLLSIKPDAQMSIVEMGASHVGDIEFLCNIVEPNYALLTNIGTAHIEGFGSKENIVKTKTELFRFVEKYSGTAFINLDDENIKKNKPKKTFTYSLLKDNDADIKANIINNGNTFASLKYNGEEINSHLVGSYNCYNMLAAISVGVYFGVDKNDIKDAIGNYIPTNNRSEVMKTKRNTLILDCYNANPSSCEKALEAFNSMHALDKRVYLGSMKELGSVSEKEHKRIAEIVKNMSLNQAIFVGEEYKEFAIGDNVLWFASAKEAKSFLEKNMVLNSLILIKGSRATAMETICDAL